VTSQSPEPLESKLVNVIHLTDGDTVRPKNVVGGRHTEVEVRLGERELKIPLPPPRPKADSF
jgi:hypothetical protein